MYAILIFIKNYRERKKRKKNAIIYRTKIKIMIQGKIHRNFLTVLFIVRSNILIVRRKNYVIVKKVYKRYKNSLRCSRDFNFNFRWTPSLIWNLFVRYLQSSSRQNSLLYKLQVKIKLTLNVDDRNFRCLLSHVFSFFLSRTLYTTHTHTHTDIDSNQPIRPLCTSTGSRYK